MATAAVSKVRTDVPLRHGGADAVFAHLFRQFRRYWNGRLLSGIGTPLLYLGGLGFGLGALVNANAGGIDGLPYAVFVAPGMLASVAVQVVMSEVTYPVLGGIKWHRTYHGMIATPLRYTHIIHGVVLFATFSALSVGLLYLIVAALLGTIWSWWGIAAVFASALGGLAFGLPIFAYASTLSSDPMLTVVQRFLVMPMMLFSATFFPLDQLPGWTHPIAQALPLWHSVDMSRQFTTGALDWVSIGGHTAVLGAYCLLGYLAVRITLRRRMVV